MKRRQLLKSGVALGAMWLGVRSGVLRLREAMAAWPRQAFEGDSVSAALQALYGSQHTRGSDEIGIDIPDLAENGAVVPIKINTTITGVEELCIFGDKNPVPLIARFVFSTRAAPPVSTRIKLADSSNVVVAVKTAAGVFRRERWIEVSEGGCG